jgi:hypothetical protein
MNRKTDLLLRRSSTVCNWARQSDPDVRRDCTKQTQHNNTRLQKTANFILILILSNVRIAFFAPQVQVCDCLQPPPPPDEPLCVRPQPRRQVILLNRILVVGPCSLGPQTSQQRRRSQCLTRTAATQAAQRPASSFSYHFILASQRRVQVASGQGF